MTDIHKINPMPQNTDLKYPIGHGVPDPSKPVSLNIANLKSGKQTDQSIKSTHKNMEIPSLNETYSPDKEIDQAALIPFTKIRPSVQPYTNRTIQARTYLPFKFDKSFLSRVSTETSTKPASPNIETKMGDVKRNDLFPFIQHHEIRNTTKEFSTMPRSFTTEKVNVLEPYNVSKKSESTSSSITAMDWTADLLVLGYADASIKLWKTEQEKFKLNGQLDGHTDQIHAVKIYKDFLISASADMTISIWDIQTHKFLSSLRGHKSNVTCLYAGWQDIGSGESEVIISGSEDGSIKIWSFKTGTCLKTFEEQSSGITSLSVIDGIIITGSKDETIRGWDITKGTCIFTLRGHSGDINCLLCDGKYLISGSSDRTLRIWDLEKESCFQVLYGHHSAITCLNWSDHYIASGSADKTIRIWNRTTLRPMKLLKGHSQTINCISIRDHFLLSAAQDQQLILWDLVNGTCTAKLNGSSIAKELDLELV